MVFDSGFVSGIIEERPNFGSLNSVLLLGGYTEGGFVSIGEETGGGFVGIGGETGGGVIGTGGG